MITTLSFWTFIAALVATAGIIVPIIRSMVVEIVAYSETLMADRRRDEERERAFETESTTDRLSAKGSETEIDEAFAELRNIVATAQAHVEAAHATLITD